MHAHPTSLVVMDIAAFKVSYTIDIDATALRAARGEVKLHRGYIWKTCLGKRFNWQTLCT